MNAYETGSKCCHDDDVTLKMLSVNSYQHQSSPSIFVVTFCFHLEYCIFDFRADFGHLNHTRNLSMTISLEPTSVTGTLGSFMNEYSVDIHLL